MFWGGEDEKGWGRTAVVGLGVGMAAVAEMFRERVEVAERFLQELLWVEWTEYCGRTKKLIPWGLLIE